MKTRKRTKFVEICIYSVFQIGLKLGALCTDWADVSFFVCFLHFVVRLKMFELHICEVEFLSTVYINSVVVVFALIASASRGSLEFTVDFGHVLRTLITALDTVLQKTLVESTRRVKSTISFSGRFNPSVGVVSA
jgi:hypothetical protein